jgi:hypothetical protein
MKTKITARDVFFVLMAGATVLSSCKKEDSTTNTTSSIDAIAVVASASIAGSDSVYLVNGCNRGEHMDSVGAAALPAAISSYPGTNFPNYVFHKAFVLTNSSAATTGYLVLIYFNDKPVGLKFDAAGAFVKVLEQRERGDLSGPGWHHGGRFAHRDGQQKDTPDCSTPKSYSTDVGPIIQSYCASNSGCHATGSHEGPGALTSFQQVYNNRTSIRSSVANGSMPENTRLSAEQKNGILCWIDNGANNN